MTERDRAIALYTFLKEFVQLRHQDDPRCFPLRTGRAGHLGRRHSREDGCHCIAWHRNTAEATGGDAPEEVWIELRKPDLTPPPEPPESVRPWVRREQLDDSSLEHPELSPALPGESDEDPPIELDDHPEVQDTWDAYIEGRWRLWAEQDRRERLSRASTPTSSPCSSVNSGLVRVFEVVFGLGFLIWNAPDGHMVRRHLITAHVTVSFDHGARNSHRHTRGGRCPPLSRTGHAGSAVTAPIQRNCARSRTRWSSWASRCGQLDRSTALLKSWVHSASSEGQFTDALERPERAASAPMVHLAPALILRRRTERSFIRAFQEIIDQLNSDHPVPEGCRHICQCLRRFRARGESGHTASPGEIYFPPANEEQREIVRRLTANQGVLVQGRRAPASRTPS